MSVIMTSTTTLGCPDWDLETVIRNVASYGYDAVDFRGLGEALDVTVLPEFTTKAAETKWLLAQVGLGVSAISSSIRLCVPEAERENLDEARRTVEVCEALDVPYVRVFGMGDFERHSREALADIGAGMMEKILDIQGARQILWCVETHDHWIAARDVRLLLDRIPCDCFGVMWDVNHTIRIAKESPAESIAAFGKRLFNTHFKDALFDPHHPHAMKDGWRYVPVGEGETAMGEAIRVLREHGYHGFLTFEHEKRWHPNLPAPEEAFPHALRWFREQLDLFS